MDLNDFLVLESCSLSLDLTRDFFNYVTDFKELPYREAEAWDKVYKFLSVNLMDLTSFKSIAESINSSWSFKFAVS